MLRGHRTYLSLFQPDQSATITTAPEKRGRNEEYIKRRNELLMHRHFFHAKIRGVSHYEQLVFELSNEFFLTERTVVDIVQNNTKILNELKNINPNTRYFKNKFPFMNWEC